MGKGAELFEVLQLKVTQLACPKKSKKDQKVTWNGVVHEFFSFLNYRPTKSYKWDEITPATQVIY